MTRMRSLATAALIACLALASAGCGEEKARAAGYTCGQTRHSAGALRDQARVLVTGEGLRARRLSREEAVLDAEFRIRRACDGAAADYRPYDRAAALSSPGWISAGSAR
jgi:hypothetical protein